MEVKQLTLILKFQTKIFYLLLSYITKKKKRKYSFNEVRFKNAYANSATFSDTILRSLALRVSQEQPKTNHQKLIIDSKLTNSSENFTLLDLEGDSNLTFDEHFSRIGNNSPGQVKAPSRIEYSRNFEERKMLIDIFIYANFTYY